MENRYLYRAKRIDNGEWVEGYLSYPFCTKKGNESYYFYAKDSLGFFCRCVVDASTICQCTGLKDENGKLIWENDIVEISREHGYFIVEWQEDDAMWAVTQCGVIAGNFYNYWGYELEVIGNIFDNQELLET